MTGSSTRGGTTCAELDVEGIRPDPAQPRRAFVEADLRRLAETLERNGQVQSIAVRPDGAGGHLIVVGERRWRAARMAGWRTIRAEVLPADLGEAAILERQLVENEHRAGLRPLELAAALTRLMELNGWTARRAAESVRLSPATVTRTLSLLALPQALQERVDSGALGASVAYTLGQIEDPALRDRLAAEAVAGTATRADIEAAALGEARAPRRRGKERLGFEVGGAVLTVVAGTGLSLAQLVETLEAIVKEARRQPARDVPAAAFARLLALRAKARREGLQA